LQSGFGGLGVFRMKFAASAIDLQMKGDCQLGSIGVAVP
jgi:hypothetical protein